MSSTASLGSVATRPDQRLDVLFEELAELAGQRNAIDGRIVEIVAEIDRDELCGITGARSIAALVGWKMGSSSANAHTIATVARRLEAFPLCAQGMAEGRLSLDQVGVIAARAGEGSDAHYAQLASVATVNQLRTAVKLEPRPEPEPGPRTAALDHQDLQRTVLLLADQPWASGRGEVRRCAGVSSGCADHRVETRSRQQRERRRRNAPPLPGSIEAFLRLVEAGWDVEAARRPHGHHTTVVVHVDA